MSLRGALVKVLTVPAALTLASCGPFFTGHSREARAMKKVMVSCAEQHLISHPNDKVISLHQAITACTSDYAKSHDKKWACGPDSCTTTGTFEDAPVESGDVVNVDDAMRAARG